MPREPGRYDSVCGSIFGILSPLPRVTSKDSSPTSWRPIMYSRKALPWPGPGWIIASQPEASGVPSFGLK